MKFSEQWLREWVNPAVDSSTLAEKLTMAGLEIESITPAAGAFTQVVIGQIQALKKHPQADKLNLCTVDIGGSASLPIVCGAKNVVQGGKFPVALVGATLPGDILIKPAKLRGETSQGMLCAGAELGLDIAGEGIWQLPEDAPLGMDLRQYLNLEDSIIDVGITPNRGDCLSIQGIAREVAAMYQMPLSPPAIAAPSDTDNHIQITVELGHPEHCPRYLGRVIKNINPQAKTPLWMQEKLRRSGLRSIHPVVDVTNYVMLELGQPMHAFDADKLSGDIVVRLAKPAETITLLDGQTIELQSTTLVVADQEKPQAIAGVMGAADSAVTDTTTHIFLESAFFTPLSVINSARAYRLSSDSAYRFERGVDFDLPSIAMARATELLIEIVGGVPSKTVEALSQAHLPLREAITLRQAQIKSLLGLALSGDRIETSLSALNMRVNKTTPGIWQVTPPSYRFDIAIEADLIEEVARAYGYDRLPKSDAIHHHGAQLGHALPMVKIREEIRTVLTQQGYHEVLTYGFVNPKVQGALFPDTTALSLRNPIAETMSSMRLSLWSGFIETLQYNQNRQQSNLQLFEEGLCFCLKGKDILQFPVLGGALMGSSPVHWDKDQRALGFFDLKGHVETLLATWGILSDCRFEPTTKPALHPGIAADIIYQDKSIGLIGQLHPSLQQSFDLGSSVYLFELHLDFINARPLAKFSGVPKFPSIARDLAIVVDEGVSYQSIRDIVCEIGGQSLINIDVFDLYRGESIPQGQYSIAMALTFQNKSRTLCLDEVNTLTDEMLHHLKQRVNAKVRT